LGKQTRRKRNKLPLPPAGAAFAVPLADGRFGVCRVLRQNTAEELKRHGADCRLVAGSAWIGDRVPDVRHPMLRPILHLTHHAWKNRPQMLWVSDPPPEDFIPLGAIEPSPEEQSQECYASGGWESCRIQSLAQWRWDHDREAANQVGERFELPCQIVERLPQL
jgi:hypothetical protein